MAKKNDIRNQIVTLWQKTVNQLEEISDTLMKTSGLSKIKLDKKSILTERDRLFKRMGEETYRWLEKGKTQVPKPIQDLYLRLSELMDRLMSKKSAPALKKASGKAPAKAKPSAKKPAKKTARKAAPKKAATPAS